MTSFQKLKSAILLLFVFLPNMNVYIRILFIFFCVYGSAQNPVVFDFGDELNKYSNEFYDIIETPNGTKWISSENGLLKYDGRKFEKVRNEEQKGNTVFNLQIDKKGKLWFNNLYGQFFYVKNDSIQFYKDFNSVLKGGLSQFIVKGEDIVYLFSSKGIYRSDAETIRKISDTKVLTSCYTGEKGYFIDNESRIFTIDFSTDKITQLSQLEIENSSSKPVFFVLDTTCFLFAENRSKGQFLKITDSGHLKINSPEDIAFERLINVKVVDHKVFVFTYNGTQVYEYKEDSFVYRNTFFKENKVSHLFKDSEDNYWFATLKDGIKVVPNINLLSNNFNYESYGYIVGSKAKNDRELIFYTDSGYLLFFDVIKGITKVLKVPTKNILSAIEVDPKKDIVYIGVNNNESFIYDLKKHTFQKTSLFNVAKDIQVVGDKVLYLTYNKSVLYTEKYNRIQEDTVDDSRAYTAHVSKTAQDFFIATASGVYKFSSGKKKLLQFKNEIFNATSIAETDDGTIWFSGVQNKLYYLKNNEVFNYRFKDFEPKEIKFLKAYKNELWIVSEKGLLMIDRSDKFKETLYNTRNSGISGSIVSLEVFKDKIIYTSNKEIFSIKKELLSTKKTKIPDAYFTAVTVLDKEIDISKKIELTHEKNNIKFSFNTNAFNNAENISYKYRLKNYDNTWREIEEAERSVKYLSIPPGNYVFEVFPFYIDEVARTNNKIVSIEVVVNEPFWKTKGFVFMISVLLVLILYGIVTISNKIKIEKKNREISQLLVDKKITALQLENLRSQMNPHFIFNAMNSIQDYIVHNERKLASSYLVKFSRLMRLYLEHSQVSEIFLKEEIETLELYLFLEKIRFETDFEYEILYDKNLLGSDLKIPSLLLQPFIENAIKHGLSNKKGLKKIKVSFQEKDSFFEIMIDDNGVGRQATQNKENKYKSFATKATAKRVELLNKNYNKNISVTIVDKHDEFSRPTGTTVIIQISNY